MLLAGALVSLAVRYRSGGREVRQQIKWITLAAVAFVACQVAALLGTAASGTEEMCIVESAEQLVHPERRFECIAVSQ